MNKLDRTDWEIVLLLNEDGRMPNTEIAQRLGNVSARTVSNRIKSLTKKGIISIRAIVNPEAVGYSVLADIYIQVEPGQVREVAEEVANYPETSYVACATGSSEVSIQVLVRSVQELFNFANDQIGKISGVQRTQTYILPLQLKDIDTWMPPDIILDIRDGIKQKAKQTAQV